MTKQKYIWMNGKFVQEKNATISSLNHSLHYGSAAFEGIRCYDTEVGPQVFRLKEHVDRLFHSAAVMGMKVGYSKKKVTEAILSTIKRNALRECYIRPIFYYGDRMGLLPIGMKPNFAVIVLPWDKYIAKDTLKVTLSRIRRIHPEAGVNTAKISGAYYNSIIAGLEAHKKKADEGLLLDWKGNIAEGPGENIFFVKGQVLHTPKAISILPGITRDTIMQLADVLGLRVMEKDISPKKLGEYDEAFFVGTAVEVHPIASIDKVRYTSGTTGSVSRRMRELYLEIVRGHIRKYGKWLTPVA